eukprot:gnl/Trimastix_PCT/1573.p1 GENE.gnl/Trimastix_PCT/1573~~gnl/Trimastix_PCT/1573.p1  ORF type:complete len:204 (-),score=32.13 gnl/Trimastix_PCT/1573:234-845(-)
MRVGLVFLYLLVLPCAWSTVTCPDVDQTTYKSGEAVDITLRLYKNGTYTDYATFHPVVDKHATLIVNQTYDKGYSSMQVVIQTLNSTIYSAIKQYAKSDGSSVVGYWNAYITMEMGQLLNITFENTCELCTKDLCIDGSCGVTRAEAAKLSAPPPMKIFLTWTGRDNQGTVLTSISERLTSYHKYSLQGLFHTALAYVRKVLT